MSHTPKPDPKPDQTWQAWLTTEITTSLPRWAYLAAIGGAIVLLLIALD
jgi:hypothetical protein